MSSSLLSIFDPSSGLSTLFHFKWMSGLGCFFFFNWQFWTIFSGHLLMMSKISDLMVSSCKQSTKDFKKLAIFGFSLILLISMTNEIGMFPYVFTNSSHLIINLSFSLPLWFVSVSYSFVYSFKKFISHLVPQGSPVGLSPFLVIIELISLMIRPVSLAVRLMSNILAGHMIMCLLSSAGPKLVGSIFFIVNVSILSFLTIVELGVGLIQGYVFTSLLLLYWSEEWSK